MRLATYLPALTNHGLLTNRRAIEAGLAETDIARLLRRGILLRLRRGVYVSAEQWNEADPYRGRPLLRIRAAHLVLQVPHVFSHDSASIIHGMGAPDPRTSLVHVTRERVHGSRLVAGVKHHGAPYHPDQAQLVDGLPVLDPARTAVDMVREHGVRGGLAVCDQALRRGVSRQRLRRTAAVMRSWPGKRAIDVALTSADPGAESWLESLGRQLVLELGIGRPETQFGLTDGRREVWCDLRVGRHVIEVDGSLKYDGSTGTAPADAVWREKVRQDFITGFKLGMSRLTHADLYHGWEDAKRRVLREYLDTVSRFGTDISDVTPYIIKGRAR